HQPLGDGARGRQGQDLECRGAWCLRGFQRRSGDEGALILDWPATQIRRGPSWGYAYLSDRARDILRKVYGHQEFRGRQAEIIAHVAEGGDALVLMPTGGGKSICYQIPAMLRDGVGVVISPLIALMQDQVAALKQFGVAAAFLNSSLDLDSMREIEAQLGQGVLKLLYVAPERLVNPRFLDLLSSLKIALFAIDEAHCVSQWGHDFRPEYIQLSILHERFPEVPRIALTATADQDTQREIRTRLALQDAEV